MLLFAACYSSFFSQVAFFSADFPSLANRCTLALGCSLFAVERLLPTVCCLLHAVCFSLFWFLVARRSLLTTCCIILFIPYSPCASRCLPRLPLIAVHSSLINARSSLRVTSFSLSLSFAAGCFLFALHSFFGVHRSLLASHTLFVVSKFPPRCLLFSTSR